MAIGAAISIGLSVLGMGASMMGASQSKASQKKAIENQYELDKKNWNFAKSNNEEVYNYEKDSVDIARKNNENELRYREAIEMQAYKRQMAERKRDFDQQSQAYRKSEKEYSRQVGLNQSIAQLALRDSQNKYNDQIKERGFEQQRNNLEYLKTQDTVNKGLQQNINNLKEAQRTFRNEQTGNVNALRQNLRSSTLANQEANKGKELARQRYGAQRQGLAADQNLSRVRRDSALSDLKSQQSQRNLQLQQSRDDLRAQYGDSALKASQNRGQIAANRDREKTLISQTLEDLRGNLSDQRLSKQFADQNANQRLNQQLTNLSGQRAEIFDQYGDEVLDTRQKQAGIRDAFGDKRLEAQQAAANIKDQYGDQAFAASFATQAQKNQAAKNALAANQQIADLKDQYGDARSREAAERANIRDTFGDSQLATQQLKQNLNRELSKANLSANQRRGQISSDYRRQALSADQQRGDINAASQRSDLQINQQKDSIRDTYGDQRLAKDQAVAELDDQTKYQLFESNNKIADLQGELVTSSLQYQQQRATKMFEMQAQNIANLQAEGQARASGQKGRSAALNVASAMAAAGRANTQLTDSILRGDAIQGSLTDNIRRRIGEVKDLKSMQRASNRRKKGDQTETLQRAAMDRSRLLGDADETKALNQADRRRKLGDTREVQALARSDRDRLTGDTRETQAEARKDRDLAARQADQNLARSLKDRDRGLGQSMTRQQRAKIDSKREIAQAKQVLSANQKDVDLEIKRIEKDLGRKLSDRDRSLLQNQQTLGRDATDRDRELMFAGQQLARKLKDRNRDLSQNTKEANLARGDARIAKDQARRTLDNAEMDYRREVRQSNQLKSIADSEANRLTKNVNDSLKRDSVNTQRKVQDTVETERLNNRITNNKIKLENRNFGAVSRKLDAEKKAMIASLDASLAQYGFDIKRSNNQQIAAKENFKATQDTITAALQSSTQDFNTNKYYGQQQMRRANLEKRIQDNENTASLKSMANAYKANVDRIALDQYSANITADNNRMVKPIPSPAPPKPLTYPRTVYQDPKAPREAPKPIKGVVQGGQMMSAVGSGLTSLAGINWSGLGK